VAGAFTAIAPVPGRLQPQRETDPDRPGDHPA